MVSITSGEELPTLRGGNFAASGDPDKLTRYFKGWRRSVLSEFERRQGMVLSPTFASGSFREVEIGPFRRRTRTIYHFALPDEAILPFVRQEACLPGGCGRVFKVEIHPDHDTFSTNRSTNPNVFVVKRLHSRDSRDFNRTVSLLKRLSGDLERENLIVLFATY